MCIKRYATYKANRYDVDFLRVYVVELDKIKIKVVNVRNREV